MLFIGWHIAGTILRINSEVFKNEMPGGATYK